MDLRSIFLGLAFALMWSSAFTATRMVVMDAAPLHALAVRFALSGVVGIVIARALGQSWRLTRAQWRATLLFGLFQNVIYLGCNFTAMQTVEASFAAIIAAAMPLVAALLAWVFLGERMRPLGIAGLGVGMAGVVIIMSSRLSGGTDPYGIALCIVGVVALAAATLFVRGAAGSGNMLMVVGLQMLVGAAILGVIAPVVEPFRLDLNPRLVAAFLYTAFISGLLATLVWFALVGRIGAVRAASFHYLNPFFGLLIAALLLGEVIGIWDVVGVIIVALGILAVQRSKRA
ncbi:DMT family transporter [Falsirhodobacter halotolerans]|uniref:DMT family transporter n=1 Tax=Falsirhodobacter halotolerans TaxID=1146892 RepID=UPI001FD45613|nr:DMT family transporter [Falsirhodobacter halotolerans]MCJ8138250.1 DMT family transporter [Falsirhodobacter halotolerans]